MVFISAKTTEQQNNPINVTDFARNYNINIGIPTYTFSDHCLMIK